MDVFNNLNVSEPLLVLSSAEDKNKYAEEVKKFDSVKISSVESLKGKDKVSTMTDKNDYIRFS